MSRILKNRILHRPLASFSFAIAGLHVLGLLGLLWGARTYPALWGIGLLAYTLGMRHAFDADHISAIDNTVRKLVQEKKEPTGVGYFFSLGHSTVVFLLTCFTVLTVRWVQKAMPHMQDIGTLIGTTVSGCFLLFVGVINLFVLLDLFKAFLRMKRGTYEQDQIERLLQSRGLFSRFIGPLYRMIGKSWHVYSLGFLFGLGFDTASEVALLAISAGAAEKSVPLLGILSLPILFAAGMSLMDTADEVFMTKAYRWAFDTPVRKVYFNLTVTGLTVLSALLIGSIELVQVLIQKFGFTNGLFLWINKIDLGEIGYYLVLMFVLAWALSYGVWRFFRIEKRFGSGVQ